MVNQKGTADLILLRCVFPGAHRALFYILTDSPSSESSQQWGSMKAKAKAFETQWPCLSLPLRLQDNKWSRPNKGKIGYKRGFISHGIISPQKGTVFLPLYQSSFPEILELALWICLSWGWPFKWKKYKNFWKRKLMNLLSIHFWKETRSCSHLHFHFLKCSMAVSHHVDEW